jgi:hypothetical protein
VSIREHLSLCKRIQGDFPRQPNSDNKRGALPARGYGGQAPAVILMKKRATTVFFYQKSHNFSPRIKQNSKATA